jgi:N-acetylglucosamine-6-phosphate deacetylase
MTAAKSAERFALTAELVLERGVLREGVAVVVERGRIQGVVSRHDLGVGLPVHSLGDGILAPGFVDIQVNGGGGVLFNQDPTREGAIAIAQAHRRFGSTSIFPTVITDARQIMMEAADAAEALAGLGGSGVRGVHLEGPFIDPKRKGAHDPRFIRKPTPEDIDWLCSFGACNPLLTVAPNMVEPDTIRKLTAAGVVVSLGHSDASAAEALAAIDAGAKGFTHLFNAMSGMSGRGPGMIGAALSAKGSYSGLIADGHHVDKVALKAAIAAIGRDHVVLVSDAMPTAAGGPNVFTLQGRSVRVTEGKLQLADGTLAGANITLLDAVRYVVGELDLPLAVALRMASRNPAAFAGIENRVGRIATGADADFVHLSNALDVLETWVSGISSVRA